MKGRLLEHFRAASPETLETGMAWYRIAYVHTEWLSFWYKVPVERVAGIIAAFSQRAHWITTLKRTRQLLAGEPTGGLPAARQNAARILGGANPLDILKGPKTRAFYNAIMQDATAVVLDVHMLRAMGEPARVSPKRYKELAEVLRAAAHEVGLPPAQLQAIIWCHVRGRAG